MSSAMIWVSDFLPDDAAAPAGALVEQGVAALQRAMRAAASVTSPTSSARKMRRRPCRVRPAGLLLVRRFSDKLRGEMLLGRSQVARQRILIPPFGGSNPPAPARFQFKFESASSSYLESDRRRALPEAISVRAFTGRVTKGSSIHGPPTAGGRAA
jgi:hypothetical protein